MKIIHITPSYKPAYVYGGPIVSVSALCEGLSNQQIQVEVLTTTANGESDFRNGKRLVNGVMVHYFERLVKDPVHLSISLLWKLTTILSGAQSGIIVHIHSWWNAVSILSCFVALICRAPVILSPRGMLSDFSFSHRHSNLKRAFHRMVGKHLLRRCVLHATSAHEQKAIVDLGFKATSLIANIIDSSNGEPKELPAIRPIAEPDVFKLLFLSRIHPKKGLELLLSALAGCNFKWRLSIAGDGQPEYIEKIKLLANQLKISYRINWIGHIGQDSKIQVMRHHDLFTLCSYDENFANVVLESLSVGTPVLISDQVGLHDFVTEHQLGWVTSLDSQQLRRMLTEAFIKRNEFIGISSKAIRLVQTYFNKKEILNKYIQLYQSQFCNTTHTSAS